MSTALANAHFHDTRCTFCARGGAPLLCVRATAARPAMSYVIRLH